MNDSWELSWKIAGLFGQALFGLRLLVQWYQSERARRSIIPLSFWYISIVAGWLLMLYSIYRLDPVFLIGFIINFLIYFRNLDLIFKTDGSRIRRIKLWLSAVILLAIAGVYAIFGTKARGAQAHAGLFFWYAWGLAGQLCFNLRFFLQWLYSEVCGRLVIPPIFWYLSLIGSVVLLSYAIFRMDLVFIVGQCFGLVVYVRNIRLLKREGDRDGV